MKSNNEKIRLTLLDIFTKISNNTTLNVGTDIFRELVKSNISNENRMIYILSTVSEHISSLKKTEKKEGIRLISALCESTEDVKQIFPYISRMLTILQASITDENASIFTFISSTFAEIVENCLKSEITSIDKDSNSADEKNNKKIYEILQGFCIYNMKQEFKANQICGSLCLTALIETCPLVLQPCYLKYIWENIVLFIDKVNFAAKLELLNCLISIIFASESLFRPFATVTLYKILDFLTDTDWLKRKLALNVVYTLVFYCQEEIVPLKSHIVEFLKVLKSDKVKEVREICMQTLKFIDENSQDESITELNSDSNFGEENKTSRETGKAKEASTTGISNTNASSSPNLSKNKSQLPREKEKENKPGSCSSNVITSSALPFTKPHESNAKKKKSAESITNREKNKLIPTKTEANIGDNSSMKKKYSIQEDQSLNPLSGNQNNILHNRRAITPTKMRNKKEKTLQNRSQDDSSIGNISKNIKDTSEELKPNKIINVNRNKEDNSFVNSKMVLKRDPNYSIFKTSPNTEFFAKVPQNEKGMEILVKEKESKNEGMNVDTRLNNEQQPVSLEEPVMNYVMVNKKSNTHGEQPLNGSFTQNMEDKDMNELNLNLNTNIIPSGNPLQISEAFSIGKIENKVDMPKNSKRSFNEEDLISLKVKDEEIEVIHAITNERKSHGNIFHCETKENTHPSQIDTPSSMKEILRQMKIMSDKQIFLIDTIEKIQASSQEQIDNLKEKIVKLESTIEKLTGLIHSTMNNNNNNNKPTASSDVDYINGMNKNSNSNSKSNHSTSYLVKKGDTAWSLILQELKTGNPTEAFNIALKSDDSNLIKLIEKINISQIRNMDKQVLEDSISRLVTLLTKGDNIIQITSFFKNVLIGGKCELKRVTVQNIKDILLYLASNKSQFNLKEEEMVDINLILSHLTASIGNQNATRHFEGYSNIINSFANN